MRAHRRVIPVTTAARARRTMSARARAVSAHRSVARRAGGAVVAHAPAGGVCADRPCWKQLPRLTGFKYIDRERTPDGLAYMRLFSGTGPERGPTITVKGGGQNLPLPPLPLALPARLQLQ